MKLCSVACRPPVANSSISCRSKAVADRDPVVHSVWAQGLLREDGALRSDPQLSENARKLDDELVAERLRTDTTLGLAKQWYAPRYAPLRADRGVEDLSEVHKC